MAGVHMFAPVATAEQPLVPDGDVEAPLSEDEKQLGHLGIAWKVAIVGLVALVACGTALTTALTLKHGAHALNARVGSSVSGVLLEGAHPAATTMTTTAIAWPEAWHKGVCGGKDSWPSVTAECDGCKAVVEHHSPDFTCGGYCKSVGLQCEGAYGAVNNTCATNSFRECSTAPPGASSGSSICECIVPCSLPGGDCSATRCCRSSADSCYERTPGGPATCLPSCTPGAASTCRTPFEHPLAQARETWRWPSIACVLGPGLVLVDPEAFETEYGGDCSEYCGRGAGETVMPRHTSLWISTFESTGALESCPGGGAPASGSAGVRCGCSFADRL